MTGVCVLMVASGAAWESTALGLLTDTRGVVVLKRCVDVNDLLASAASGQADVAVLALEAHGFDAAAVDHLRRHQVRAVAVTADPADEVARARAARIGVSALVAERGLELLPGLVLAAEADDPGPDTFDESVPDDLVAPGTGRVVVVWGPAGAPGRTTVALALAAELAHRAGACLAVDADPHAPSVAQHLGVLDEVSGLLAAARLYPSGDLEDRFPSVQRDVGGGLRVLTGLPRPDRWVEVRPGTVEHVLEVAGGQGQVVVDTGFSLDDDGADLAGLPGRNAMTLAALAVADEIVVVGSADPVGLSRLAHGLVQLRERTGGAAVRVVVNRMRPTLGWTERDIAGMVEGFARLRGLHFLPDDRVTVDRALISSRTLVELGDTPLRRSVAEVADQLAPDLAGAAAPRRRRAGRAR
jgi:MinD-like ATPase involved in chromosome partitioning or flagellar assembly